MAYSLYYKNPRFRLLTCSQTTGEQPASIADLLWPAAPRTGGRSSQRMAHVGMERWVRRMFGSYMLL